MHRATVDATAHARSLWDDTLPDPQRCNFEPLHGAAEFDVVIVGAGLTGAWTSYYLAGADPTLRIAVLERHGLSSKAKVLRKWVCGGGGEDHRAAT